MLPYAGNDIKNYAGQVIVTKGTALQTVTTGEDGKAAYTVDLPFHRLILILDFYGLRCGVDSVSVNALCLCHDIGSKMKV